MIIRYLLTVLCVLVYLYSYSQLKDDFSQPDLSHWTGTTDDFIINGALELQLNASGAGESYLVRQNGLFDDSTVWEFRVSLDFNPSSSNFVKVYLASDQEDLTGDLNGYFVMIGDTEDEISLYRQEGSSESYLIDGEDKIISESSVDVRVRVIRSKGEWFLFQDLTGGTAFNPAGNHLENDPFPGPLTHVGFYCDYTSTRSDKIFFDDLIVKGEVSVDSVEVLAFDTIKVLFNQPVLAPEIGHFSLLDTAGNVYPTDHVDSISSSGYQLVTNLNTSAYLLQISEVRDSIFQHLNTDLTYEFSYERLELINLQTPDETLIELTFNQKLSVEFSEGNFQISDENPISDVRMVEDSVIQVKLMHSLQDETSYELNIFDIFNIAENSLLDTAVTFSYVVPILVDAVEVVAEDEIKIEFNKKIHPSSAGVIENYSINPLVDIDEVVLSESQKSVHLFLTDQLITSDYRLTVRDLIDQAGYAMETPIEDSFSFLKLAVDSITQEAFSDIRIFFNQSLDVTSASENENYFAKYLENPQEVTMIGDSSVLLEFKHGSNAVYELTLQNIYNEHQNSAIKDTISFRLENSTEKKQIVFTELLPDPTPVLGLPDAEFVEIYNRSNLPVNLEGFTLNEEILPDVQLAPDSFLVITDDSDVFRFDTEQILGLTSFDVLTNSGEAVVLMDPFEKLVDSLFYDPEWYDSDSTDDGGYSLELNNPNLTCHDDYNWSYSRDESGGTPGRENSIWVIEEDLSEPQILEFEVLRPDSIVVCFDEAVKGFHSELDYTGFSYSKYVLTSPDSLLSESAHEFILTQIEDCQGNVGEQSIDFYLDYTAPKLVRSFFISKNEIALIFHEALDKFDSEQEDHYLISNSQLPIKADLQDSSARRIHLTLPDTFQHVVMEVDHLEDTMKNKIEPLTIDLSFSSYLDTVKVLAPDLLEVQFKIKTDQNSVKKNTHYFIPGIGYPNEVFRNEESVQLRFTKNFRENKEYRLYLENIKDTLGNIIATPARSFESDTDPPGISHIVAPSDSIIRLKFNEQVDILTMINPLNYEIDGIKPSEVVPLEVDSARLIPGARLKPEQQFELKITGISDLLGNRQEESQSYQAVFDLVPPSIDTVYQINDSSLVIVPHEPLAGNSISDLFIEFEDLKPYGTKYEMDEVAIIFPDMLPRLEKGMLLLSGWQDLYDNILQDTLVWQINTIRPFVHSADFLRKDVIRLQFSGAIDSTSFFIVEGKEVEVHKFDSLSFSVHLSENLQKGDSISLDLSGVFARNGESVQNPYWKLRYDTYFEKYEIRDPRNVELFFQKKIKDENLAVFSGFQLPAIITVDNEDARVVRLHFREDIPSDTLLYLSWEYLKSLSDDIVPGHEIGIYFDQSGPKIKRIESDFDGKIMVLLDEAVNEDRLSTSSFQIEGKLPVNYEFFNDSLILIEFENLVVDHFYSLEIFGLEDTQGNITDTLDFPFQYLPPQLPGSGDIIFSEIMADPTPSEGLPEREYVELYNRSGTTFNLTSILIGDKGTRFRLPDYILSPGSYVVLSNGKNIFSIENHVDMGRSISLGNDSDSLFIRTINDTPVDQVSYDQTWYRSQDRSEGGFSLELINPEGHCDQPFNWKASESITGGTPGEQSSVFSSAGDTINPVIDSYEILSEREMKISFSEKMEMQSLQSGTFLLEGDTVWQLEIINDRELNLMFSQLIIPGFVDTLAISGARDCTGNEMDPVRLPVVLPDKPGKEEIVFTEVMADPEPVMGLPAAEYVEIFNRSAHVLSLENVQLADERGRSDLIGGVIFPGEYIVLTQGDFEEEAIDVSGWRALSNDGEWIGLIRENDTLTSLLYQSDWHKEDQEGGVSLERMNTENFCGKWSSSINEKGGTPGEKNSIWEELDKIPPRFDSLVYISADSISLKMNEAITTYQGSSFSLISNEIEKIHVDETHISIIPRDSLYFNTNHQLTLTELRDCNGNVSQPETIDFFLPAPPGNGLMINEILFNPHTEGNDFIEIFNASDNYFLLNGAILENEKSEIILELPGDILPPGEYRVFTPGPEYIRITYPNAKNITKVNNIPPMNDDEGYLVLRDNDRGVIDSIWYSEKFHSSFLNEVEGVSLERISFEFSATGPNNWASASGIEGFATPGYENSQKKRKSQGKKPINLEPRVFVPGNGNPAFSSFTSIEYQLEDGDTYANVNIYNSEGNVVRQLAKNQLLGITGFLKWDGTDDSGSIVNFGRYLVVFDLFGPNGNKKRIVETVVVGW